ncbi:hypothetical protein [Lactiplantibacillus daowaiensis]|uniref:Uncharacterized protein n=1 Tax=Lactiplantibacillus daowaiensis TaxID=2559918 RepID=A0ABW1RYQ5_9LACO|nr:hypothetical protein [Lactiplantibacillus daowaiensis]
MVGSLNGAPLPPEPRVVAHDYQGRDLYSGTKVWEYGGKFYLYDDDEAYNDLLLAITIENGAKDFIESIIDDFRSSDKPSFYALDGVLKDYDAIEEVI